MNKERTSRAQADVVSSEFQIDPNQEGLIGKYMKSKHEHERQGILAKALREAIEVKQQGLMDRFATFIDIQAKHSNVTSHTHPPKNSKKTTISFTNAYISEDGQTKREVSYSKTTVGNNLVHEGVKIKDPASFINSFDINLKTKTLSMRDATSQQTLHFHHDPHIVYLTDETNPEKMKDLLDEFNNQIGILESAKVSPSMP